MYPKQQEKILEAILREARASGIADTFVALIERIYHNQQELSVDIMHLENSVQWARSTIEKRIDKIEEKVDPEEAAKRKRGEGCCEVAKQATNLQKSLGLL